MTDKLVAFDAAAWLEESLKGGIAWTLTRDDRLWSYMSTRYINPVPMETWDRLEPDFNRHYSEIITAMRAIVGAGAWYVWPDQIRRVPPDLEKPLNWSSEKRGADR